MNSVFLLSGKTLCIRRLKERDLQQCYYERMSLLSDTDRSILRIRNTLDSLENEHIYFVIEDMKTQMIVGTCSIIITNVNSKIGQTGYIENIMIRKDYENIGLGDKIFQHVKYYCMNTKHCIKVITNCDHNI